MKAAIVLPINAVYVFTIARLRASTQYALAALNEFTLPAFFLFHPVAARTSRVVTELSTVVTPNAVRGAITLTFLIMTRSFVRVRAIRARGFSRPAIRARTV